MKKCPFCAEQIQEEAVVCRYCSRELPGGIGPRAATAATSTAQPPARNLLKFIAGAVALLFVGGGILAVLLIGLVATRSGTDSSVSTAPAVTITAGDLVARYVENEVAADRTYKDKVLIVKGFVDSIGKDILGSPYLVISSGSDTSFRSVQATFDRKYEVALAAIQKGNGIAVRCRCKGLMMNVQLDGCQLQ